MAITELSVSGYRSMRDVRLELGPVNVIVGPNGSGKTNLYRSMFLLHGAASGAFARSVVEEGGMGSVLWAGERRTQPVRMSLGMVVGELAYELVCGLPSPDRAGSSSTRT